jgi:hypothetical protein
MKVIDPCVPASTTSPILWRKAYNEFLHLHDVRQALRAEGCLASTTAEDAQHNRLLKMWGSYARRYLVAPHETSFMASSGPAAAAGAGGRRRLFGSPGKGGQPPSGAACRTPTRPKVADDVRASASTPTSPYRRGKAESGAAGRWFACFRGGD